MPADYDAPLGPPQSSGRHGDDLPTPYVRRLRPRHRRRIVLMYRVDTIERYIEASGRREGFMRSKGGVLELAVLGLLHESPMHGYELRKRLNTLLGMFRAFSYGSLYPCLKQLLGLGLITEDDLEPAAVRPAATRRSKIVYKLTAEGKEHLQELLAEAGPASWEGEGFGVHIAYFAP